MKETNLWYVQKGYAVKELGVSKVHIVDDACNEFTALVLGVEIMRGYYNPVELNIVGLKEYKREDWDALQMAYEYGITLEKF